jgi:hypothetical protein
MHARVSTLEGPPDRMDEGLRHVREQVLPLLHQQDVERYEVSVFEAPSTGPVSGVTDSVGGVTDTVGGTVSGTTDSVRGVTDNLLGGEEKQQR